MQDAKGSTPEYLRQCLLIQREKAAELGREVTEILDVGHYLSESGTRVDIRQQVDRAVSGTVSYPPERELPLHSGLQGTTRVEVWNETTLGAALALRTRGFEPAALNFASAVVPGGGFLMGARAQEEYLTRSSALIACLRDNPMYTYHRSHPDPFYSDYVIYSPEVPVIRNDLSELLEEPYPCSIITSPAVQADAVGHYCPDRVEEIPSAMWSRILKVLAVAEHHGHRALVLGAWGCGAFGNDSDVIAGLFHRALEENFCGAFQEVIFAVTDWSAEEKTIGPFKRGFGGGRIQFSN